MDQMFSSQPQAHSDVQPDVLEDSSCVCLEQMRNRVVGDRSCDCVGVGDKDQILTDPQVYLNRLLHWQSRQRSRGPLFNTIPYVNTLFLDEVKGYWKRVLEGEVYHC